MAFTRKKYPARVENLPEASEFVEESAAQFGLDAKKMFGLQLALEEAFVNICSYAYKEGVGDAELTCQWSDDTFALEMADSGEPFDLLSLPDPDLSLDMMDREIGGLGIHFIRKMSDRVSYRRENGHNILRMEFVNKKPSNA